MLTSVGHDLRTPLSALRAAVEALADGVAPDPERYLRAMAHDVEALGALIDDVFLLASIESGRLDLHREPIDLSELADEAVEALSPAAAARRVTLSLVAGRRAGQRQRHSHRTSDPQPHRQRDPPRPRRLRRRRDRRRRRAPRRCASSIAGPGFPAEFSRHVFEPFARADPSRTRATGGAGLGLVIARGLVEAHGGRIWIEQPDGARTGARVAFDLPGT